MIRDEIIKKYKDMYQDKDMAITKVTMVSLIDFGEDRRDMTKEERIELLRFAKEDSKKRVKPKPKKGKYVYEYSFFFADETTLVLKGKSKYLKVYSDSLFCYYKSKDIHSSVRKTHISDIQTKDFFKYFDTKRELYLNFKSYGREFKMYSFDNLDFSDIKKVLKDYNLEKENVRGLEILKEKIRNTKIELTNTKLEFSKIKNGYKDKINEMESDLTLLQNKLLELSNGK